MAVDHDRVIHLALCTDGVFPQALGGMQRHSRLLAEHLVRQGGVRLTVLHPHVEQVFDPALGIAEVRVPPIDPDKFYLRELWRYSGRVAQALDTLGPEVVLSQGFCVWQGIGRFRERLIVHPHGLEMFQGLTWKERAMGTPFRMALRHIVRRSAVVVSLGGKLSTILQRLSHGSGCHVAVLPNAVDVPDAPWPMPSAAQELSLLFVGRFAFNKGLDVLVEAARRLHAAGDRRVRFRLAGDGPLRARYQAMGLPPNVELLGRVDDDALLRHYRESHALVLPTRFEGMPTVALEAMAQGRPVIVSDVGATAELVDSGNGFLLPPGDADAFHAAVQRFAALPPEQLSAMGAAAFHRAREHFAWPGVTRRYLELFRGMTA